MMCMFGQDYWRQYDHVNINLDIFPAFEKEAWHPWPHHHQILAVGDRVSARTQLYPFRDYKLFELKLDKQNLNLFLYLLNIIGAVNLRKHGSARGVPLWPSPTGCRSKEFLIFHKIPLNIINIIHLLFYYLKLMKQNTTKLLKMKEFYDSSNLYFIQYFSVFAPFFLSFINFLVIF